MKWMPSHLGEKGQEECRINAVSDGLVDDYDIEGNDEADKLAKAGVEMHDSNKCHVAAARGRRAITIITQKIMLHVWENYVDKCNAQVKSANQVDEDEVHRMMLRAEYGAQDDYDTYDPFVEITAYGNELHASSTTGGIASTPVSAARPLTNPETAPAVPIVRINPRVSREDDYGTQGGRLCQKLQRDGQAVAIKVPNHIPIFQIGITASEDKV